MKINKAFIVGSVIAVPMPFGWWRFWLHYPHGYSRLVRWLGKTFFTPPNGLFAPVWTTLYILMGIAAGGVWAKGLHHRWVKTALYHFAAQLVVNALWTLAFWLKAFPNLD